MTNIFPKLLRLLFVATYTYLALPIFIFFLFWLKRPIGILAALLVLLGVFICWREHDFQSVGSIPLSGLKKGTISAIFLIVTFWVILSGIGGYVWQNSDHDVRNEIFNETVLNPPAELGRLADASGDKQSTRIYPLLYNRCRSGKPHKTQRRHIHGQSKFIT